MLPSNIKNSYDNRCGYGGNLFLTMAFAVSGVVATVYGLFIVDPDTSAAVLFLGSIALLLFVVSFSLWYVARERHIDENRPDPNWSMDY